MTVKELSAPQDRIEGRGDRTKAGYSTGMGVITRGGFTLENVLLRIVILIIHFQVTIPREMSEIC